MKKKHLLRSIIAIILCVLMIGTAIAVGYTVYENAQGKKVVIDKDNNKPFVSGSASATVTTENGVTKEEVTLKSSDESILAVIPAGTKLNDGVEEVTLTVKEIKNGQANVELGENEEKSSYDVHVEGVAADNTTPIKVVVKEMLAKGLNIGNYKLYHVENGATVEMTLFDGEVTHNSFEYDPATGDVTLYLASFSEVAVVENTENKWNGTFDYSWYDADSDALFISNADQLAAFGAIVGGMNGKTRDSFENKTVTLTADINLGDKESENNPDVIFHPIGYYFTLDNNGDGTQDDVYSTVYSFCGTFDGNGHTIANFYQNTWEIKGDYNSGYPAGSNYYKDGMGLFGYVSGGTVKNLTVDHFSSDGEFTPTGVIAAYADNSEFINIAITNCNPKVYNTGNGGIVGVGGDSSDTSEQKLNFTNITIDNTNKISALWGSWDVACGGIMGMFRGYSKVTMTNCHVAAQIDVYNDVCGNYQYYWYRYAGMLIGSLRGRNTTDTNGYTVPDMTDIKTVDCTVHFGEWNDYYYCELVANSIASYTHDHQFSRLTQIASLDEIKSGETWLKTGNFLLIEGETKTCYHIVNKDGVLTQHNHVDAGYEDSIDEDGDGNVDLREDKQIVYLPFNQLFQGDGWGVKHVPIYDDGKTYYEGVTILDREVADSVEKFESSMNGTSIETNTSVNIGDLFQAIENADVEIDVDNVQVTVSPADQNSTVVGTYTANTKDWTKGTLVFTGLGNATITITDYYYCTPTTITVTVSEPQDVVKFEAKDNLSFEHTLEKGTINKTLGDIFAAVNGAEIDSANVEVVIENNGATCTYTKISSDWKQSTLAFTGVGSVTFTITDNNHCVVSTAVVEISNPELVEKFIPNSISAQNAYTRITLGTIFVANLEATIYDVTATVTTPDNTQITLTGTSADWFENAFDLTKEGVWTVVITDNNFCKSTTTTFTVNKVDKFTKKFDKDFVYRVGNANNSPVTLGTIFSEIETAVALSSVDVTITNVAGNASGAFTSNATWSNGKIQFSGTGVVKVTISADGANDVSINLEVVDAVNATVATSATSSNVVLLQNCGFGSLEVSGGYTLYGNGFTITCGSDSAALDTGYAFVNLNNGILDNIQIVCPNFDYAVLYKSNATDSGNRSETTDRTRYFNVKSGVMVEGNSQILNSRISGARAAVNLSSGNLLIDNSQIEGGAVATLLVGAANSLKLRDVTLIQKPMASTYNPNKKLMGFSVLYVCDSDGIATSTTIEGSFVQQAWASEDEKSYVPSSAQDIVDKIMNETAYVHKINGKDSVNLGFAYLPEDPQKTVDAPENITDNRTDKATIPYETKDVKIQISILSTTVYVFSYKNTNGTADSFINEIKYISNKYSDIITVNYADESDGITDGKSFGTDGWTFELNVDLDKLSGYAIDFSKLSMSVNGVTVSDYKVNGGTKPTSPIAVTAGGTTYTLTAIINEKEYSATFKVTGTETSKESPSLVASNYAAGTCVASSHGGTWSGAAPALEGIQIKYWSVAEKQYKTINLADYTPTTKGKLNGANTTWTYSPDNGDFTLTLTGGQVHSSNKVNAIPVCVDTDGNGTGDTLFFVAATTNGLVNSGNSARAVPVSYTFKDNNNGDVLTFSHTWSVAENQDAEYNYSDFVSGTYTKLEASGGGGCVAPDTLITLADGTQVRVDSLTGNEELLVWNLETGMLDKAPIMFVDNDAEMAVNVIKLVFSDGTEVKAIYEHGFWDYDLNKYVYLDENASEYIGHYFAKQNGESLEKVQLVDVVIEKVITTAWSPVTQGHLCYFVNGMLSMPGGVGGLFNIFEVDADTMTYDYDAMAKDIEKYGLFTYEELNAICPLSREMFEQAGGAYLKISIAKGNLTMEELIYMINRYSVFF